MRESFIHVVMRQYLKDIGWTLVAGEYPGGTDDELYVLSIVNPEVARDNSPDPRRHSEGEIIPDLFAYKDNVMLIIEAKPKYSLSDKNKLKELIYTKQSLLKDAVIKFCKERRILNNVNLTSVQYLPVLAFGNKIDNIIDEEDGFGHIYIENFEKARLVIFGEECYEYR